MQYTCLEQTWAKFVNQDLPFFSWSTGASPRCGRPSRLRPVTSTNGPLAL
jgi:hypothetical protein